MGFTIYKRGQGYYTRLISALAGGLIVALGCLRLYQKLATVNVNNANVRLLIQTLVPIGVFVSLAWVLYWLVNKPSVADFMIAAEGEMKKVSWSSRKEIAVSTFVVIIVVAAMSILMAVTDVFFQFFFRAIRVLQ